MPEMKNRPEDPKLDREQMADLEKFLAQRSAEQLKVDLAQTAKGAEQGGATANVNKAFIAIQDALVNLLPKKK